MHTEVLTASQLAVLERLKELPAVCEFYLAGGTALALRHGHRRSIDFDFFRPTRFDEDGLSSLLEQASDTFERLPTGEQTLYVLLSGVTTSFFRYPYPQLEQPEATPWGFTLASDADIAAMKIEAIAGRGSRKDFVDLRLLCRSGLTVEAAFDLFDRKFGTQRTDRYHRLRALTYFDDAEHEPLPDMLVPFDWDEAKRFFTAEAMRLLASEAG
ncbi:MAG: nucleotidyl transferase AbiEii/AbiGii toxin family protein [Thermoanaerobaculia bacterium]